MSWIIELDKSLLKWINQIGTHPLADQFFPFLTDMHRTWGFKFVFAPLLILLLFYKKKFQGLLIFLMGAMAVGFTDYVSHNYVKEFFQRPRPPLADPNVILRAPHYGGYSFPSNHAANMACMAMFFGFFFPRLRLLLFTFAVLVAYSRVYVGVHYPADVTAGFLWGSLLGFLFALIAKKIVFKGKRTV